MNLHRLSKVKPAQLDSVQASKQEPGGENRRAMDVLLQAQAYYQAMNKFRNDRERNKRYNYGDQWGTKSAWTDAPSPRSNISSNKETYRSRTTSFTDSSET